jgi:hypothetical protein
MCGTYYYFFSTKILKAGSSPRGSNSHNATTHNHRHTNNIILSLADVAMRISSALLAVFAASARGCVAFTAVLPSSSSVVSLHSSSSSSSSREGRWRRSSLSSTAEEVGSGTAVGVPGTADLPWSELGFEYRDTKSHLKMVYRDGKWEEPTLVSSPHMQVHIGATALHYGQACFEGLKAFAHADGDVFLFRPDENGMRINRSAHRVMMPEIPVEMFVRACNDVVKDNIAYGELLFFFFRVFFPPSFHARAR